MQARHILRTAYARGLQEPATLAGGGNAHDQYIQTSALRPSIPCSKVRDCIIYTFTFCFCNASPKSTCGSNTPSRCKFDFFVDMFCQNLGPLANKSTRVRDKNPKEKQIPQQSRLPRHFSQTLQDILFLEVLMAALDSPRRILGERDVNKPSSTGSSPSKLASFPHNNALYERTLDLGKPSHALLSPKMHDAPPSPASVSSPSGNRKRGAACLGNAQDGPPRKQAVIGLSQDNCDDNRPRAGDSKTHSRKSLVDDRRVRAAVVGAAVSILSINTISNW
jgi:hypothetical protein